MYTDLDSGCLSFILLGYTLPSLGHESYALSEVRRPVLALSAAGPTFCKQGAHPWLAGDPTAKEHESLRGSCPSQPDRCGAGRDRLNGRTAYGRPRDIVPGPSGFYEGATAFLAVSYFRRPVSGFSISLLL